MNNKVYGVFSSSEDPTQISLTVASAVKGGGAFLLTLISLHLIPEFISSADVQSISDALTISIGAGFTMYHSVQIIYGFFRKILNFFYNPPTPQIDSNTNLQG